MKPTYSQCTTSASARLSFTSNSGTLTSTARSSTPDVLAASAMEIMTPLTVTFYEHRHRDKRQTLQSRTP